MDMLNRYLEEARSSFSYVVIKNKNTGKKFCVQIINYDQDRIFYMLKNTKKEGNIFIKNVASIIFEDAKKERAFRHQYQDQILDYKNYYMRFIKTGDENEIKSKVELFDIIFNSLYHQDNLLLKYLKKELPQYSLIKEDIPILINSSNLSQKKAILNSLQNVVSVIEGPPGCGKTTTILSLIANLIMQDKKVIVVSKNNSAVDNIIEEYTNLQYKPFWVRFGRGENVMAPLMNHHEMYLNDLKKAFSNINTTSIDVQQLNQLKNKLITKEKELQECILLDSTLKELNNQKRYMDKRMDCYQFYELFTEKEKKHFKYKLATEKNIDQVIRLAQKEHYHLLERLRIRWKYHLNQNDLDQKIIGLKNILEELYLKKEIVKIEEQEIQTKVSELKNEIKDLYQHYINICQKAFISKLGGFISRNIDRIKQSKMQPQEKLYHAFPLILTTADAFLFNFRDAIKAQQKFDCIIIDEATQCDVITGLPLLYMAKQLIVVGDCKQLSAITKEAKDPLPVGIDKEHQQEGNNFLKSVKNVFHPNSILLKEHYRCDYNIINFCNKFYYEDELQIYTERHYDSMNLINVNQQKSCQKTFCNEREIVVLETLSKGKEKQSFFITPFKKQGEAIKKELKEEDKKDAGTIHTFQGKGNQDVYFSSVLNDLPVCVNHIRNSHNLFTKELINVAVSRAKNNFTLVGDIDFFKKYENDCIEMKHLIEYIEIYGNEITNKTVCLLDNLYKNIPFYNKTKEYDNEYEEALHTKIKSILTKYPHCRCYMKLPLEYLILDKQFLQENPSIKTFILNKKYRSHVDYTIINTRLHKPVLTIELDGKYHDTKKQQERDQKKNRALQHMGIPILRIGSKEVLKIEKLNLLMEPYLK